MVDNLLKIEYFHQTKLSSVFIIYAQIYLQNFKTFDAIFFFFKFTKITFFEAVKLVVPLNSKILSFFGVMKWVICTIFELPLYLSVFFCYLPS